MLPRLPTLRWVAFGLAAGVFVVAVLLHFLPLASFSETIALPGNQEASVGAEAHVWEGHFHAEGFEGASSEDTSWYDNDFDDDDGITMLRVGAPILVSGGVVALVSAIAFLRAPRLGVAMAALTAVLLLVGLVLMVRGITALFEDEHDWAVGLWLGMLGVALAAASAAVGLLPPPAAPSEPLPTPEPALREP